MLCKYNKIFGEPNNCIHIEYFLIKINSIQLVVKL